MRLGPPWFLRGFSPALRFAYQDFHPRFFARSAPEFSSMWHTRPPARQPAGFPRSQYPRRGVAMVEKCPRNGRIGVAGTSIRRRRGDFCPGGCKPPDAPAKIPEKRADRGGRHLDWAAAGRFFWRRASQRNYRENMRAHPTASGDVGSSEMGIKILSSKARSTTCNSLLGDMVGVGDGAGGAPPKPILLTIIKIVYCTQRAINRSIRHIFPEI
jgi:hypothetical protein